MTENSQKEEISVMKEILRNLKSIRSGGYPGTYDADTVIVNSLITRARGVVLRFAGKDSIYNQQIIGLIGDNPNLNFYKLQSFTGIFDAFVQDYGKELMIEKKSNTSSNKTGKDSEFIMIDDYKLEVFRKNFKTIEGFIFVLMPFNEELTQMYKDYIKKPLEGEGYKVFRADDFFRPTPIIDDIWKSICEAEFIIADLTGRNPNVFYEVGLAHVLGKYTILITQSLEDIPFDLKSIRIIQYKLEPQGLKKLPGDLLKFVKAKRP